MPKLMLTPKTSRPRTSLSRTSLYNRLRYVGSFCDYLNLLRSLSHTPSFIKKTRRRTYRAHGRINPYQGHPCHVEIILSAGDEEVERSKDLDVGTTSLAGLNRRQVARKRIEAARTQSWWSDEVYASVTMIYCFACICYVTDWRWRNMHCFEIESWRIY